MCFFDDDGCLGRCAVLKQEFPAGKIPGNIVGNEQALDCIAGQLAARGQVVVQIALLVVGKGKDQRDDDLLIHRPFQLEPGDEKVIIPNLLFISLLSPVHPAEFVQRRRQCGNVDVTSRRLFR